MFFFLFFPFLSEDENRINMGEIGIDICNYNPQSRPFILVMKLFPGARFQRVNKWQSTYMYLAAPSHKTVHRLG